MRMTGDKSDFGLKWCNAETSFDLLGATVGFGWLWLWPWPWPSHATGQGQGQMSQEHTLRYSYRYPNNDVRQRTLKHLGLNDSTHPVKKHGT